MGDAPFSLKSALKVNHPFEKRRLRLISAYNVSTIGDSEKKSNYDEYIKSTMGFPTSYRWSAYVTPKSPKVWLKEQFLLFFMIKFIFNRIKSTEFHCVKTSSGKVVEQSISYMK